MTYRKFNKAKDEHGPKATKMRISNVATNETKEENGTNEIGHNISCL